MTDGSGKLRKTVYKMSAEMLGTVKMNWCNILTDMRKIVQWRDMIYVAMINRKCQNKSGVARHSTSC